MSKLLYIYYLDTIHLCLATQMQLSEGPLLKHQLANNLMITFQFNFDYDSMFTKDVIPHHNTKSS